MTYISTASEQQLLAQLDALNNFSLDTRIIAEKLRQPHKAFVKLVRKYESNLLRVNDFEPLVWYNTITSPAPSLPVLALIDEDEFEWETKTLINGGGLKALPGNHEGSSHSKGVGGDQKGVNYTFLNFDQYSFMVSVTRPNDDTIEARHEIIEVYKEMRQLSRQVLRQLKFLAQQQMKAKVSKHEQKRLGQMIKDNIYDQEQLDRLADDLLGKRPVD